MKILLAMARKYALRDAGPPQMPAHEFERLAVILANFSDNARRGNAQLLEVTSASDYAPRPQDPVMANALVAIVNAGYPVFVSFTGPNHRGMHTATLHAVMH